MNLRKPLVAVLLLLGVCSSAVTSSPSKREAKRVGPHGGQLIEDRNNQFEVTFDKEARQVSVYALRMGVGPPENMRLRLYISPDKTETVELHAVPNATDPTPMYQGKLTVAADSYLAAGVTFNVSIFG